MESRRIIKVKNFHGVPKLSDFHLVKEIVETDLKDGEILTKAEWLSVDPYMRGNYVDPVEVGDTMKGGQVARVLKSKCDEFPEGSQVVGNFGWRDITIYTPKKKGPRHFLTITEMPDMQGLPDSYALGAMGMPGNAAYHGLLDLLEPKAGDTLVVSTAAGAVGHLVVQIGKMMGCKVLGFTGSEKKVQVLKEELHAFIHATHIFNYNTMNVEKVFQEYAPEGIDLYFDNVGGEFTRRVVKYMNNSGKICQCGCISTYNLDTPHVYTDPSDMPEFQEKKLQLKPLNTLNYADRWFEGINQIRDWILEGKIKVRETRIHGLENMPKAFIDLFEGNNIGKVVVKAHEDTKEKKAWLY